MKDYTHLTINDRQRLLLYIGYQRYNLIKLVAPFILFSIPKILIKNNVKDKKRSAVKTRVNQYENSFRSSTT